MDKVACPWEMKELTATGEFVGHASVYGNVDDGGDIVEPGAFKEIVTTPEGKSVVLWMHRMDSPIGTAQFIPDSKGLRVQGQLMMEDSTARKVYTGMKAGAIRGMSFGYDVLPGGAEITPQGVRLLKGLKVWEASIVTFGMNPRAQIESFKGAEIGTPRELEDLLRDVAGLSHLQAKRLVAGGWKALAEHRDDVPTVDDVKSVFEGVFAQAAIRDMFRF